ncbi:uncharacterized protein BDW43DRAFT_315404 [Aspergillus alliaceus]|uniref:uncharacterized protein n=1 Tax=Petromyces alliaceus TaxID=209559 RepID=UPI0012A499DA|nr:uncharacterized protein BDW43DRAFT_315404 [Aspergillus alliaceus]KAB8228903.1 hypothetical protein BDW43DRAFT_315404 [Aspergillus alliaceus]
MFGGYVTMLLERILADCCWPAALAYLNTSFAHSVPPDVPIRLRAWPEKVEGRKFYLTASIQIPGSEVGRLIYAIQELLLQFDIYLEDALLINSACKDPFHPKGTKSLPRFVIQDYMCDKLGMVGAYTVGT